MELKKIQFLYKNNEKIEIILINMLMVNLKCFWSQTS